MQDPTPHAAPRNHAALPDEAGAMLDDLRAIYAEAGIGDDPAAIMAHAVKLLWLVTHGLATVELDEDAEPPAVAPVH